VGRGLPLFWYNSRHGFAIDNPGVLVGASEPDATAGAQRKAVLDGVDLVIIAQLSPQVGRTAS
jgi:hypothetical protein